MSDSLPPDHRPPRLRDDEPIALLLAFLVFGAIVTWVLGQGRDRVDLTGVLSQWTGALTTAASPSPSPNPVESAIAALTGTPNLGTPNLGTPGLGTLPTGGLGGTSSGATATAPTAPVPSPGGAIAVPPSGAVTGAVTVPSPQPQPSPGATSAPTVPSPAPSGSPVPSPPSPTSGLPASPSPSFPSLGQANPTPSLSPSASPKPGAIAFADVPQTYWAAPFIIALAERGVISGFEDGSFKPNQPVTRAQFAVQLQKAFTKPDRQPPVPFSDVPPGSYWSTAVDKAVKANFMRGYPEGDFRPEQPVSRAEAVTSLVQGLGIPEPADPEAILQPYRDRAQVPSWARGRVAAAIQQQLFSGDPDTQLLQPNQPATRADIAALVYKGLAVGQPSP